MGETNTLPSPDWSLSLHASIHEIGAEAWDACAGADNPFVSFGFLSALEDSGSVADRSGWLVRHAALRAPDGTIAALAPLYGKSHSWGEYVFDQSWARAYEAAGGRYYPKFVCAVPFSPVPGPRLLLRPDLPDPQAVAQALAAALIQATAQLGLSSLHANFCDAASLEAFTEAGYLPRTGLQYHWQNNGYTTFDDFLAALSSRKRKSIRKERNAAQSCGLTFSTLRGNDITPEDWKAFYRFYQSTIDRKWGSAYLTERFFPMLSERLGNRVVLMMAYHDGNAVAGALNLMGADALFGRNWGCEGDWPFLHFELCYYRAIAFAIEHGLSRVEAGAQGEHKIQRGYLPSFTHSAHAILDPGLRQAVAAFVEEERTALQAEAAELLTLSPYRHGESG
ncbi:GNAT family N-acetyltransferase [Gluconobacter kondonii]|uniref:GNAT family N-acetyltransferase n=1 Tax=Gluconobacter kondonii TaxID=941463 RepID=UPI00197DFF2F|nr:GNAT family N-acetyltransferase [Gluconobacter kondonii]MBN3867171.1 N-acetyltransferase [Gluconobacter kondonii]MBS1056336.1 N-acetyltransferase [Gluconobacter kondonii]